MKKTLFTHSAGQGQDLVLLHGWGVNSGVWQAISAPLQARFRVSYIDLPGFGENAQHLPSDYDLATVAELVSHSLPPSCILLGWSLGGLVAQQIALTQPERIKRLVLLASSPRFASTADWPGVDAKILSFFQQQLALDFDKTLMRFLAIQAMGSDTAKADIKQIKHSITQLPAPSLLALKGGLEILAETDLRNQLVSLKVKTHWLFGGLDTLVPSSLRIRLPALQAQASYHVFDKASHAPFISHPQTFVEHLLNVLELE